MSYIKPESSSSSPGLDNPLALSSGDDLNHLFEAIQALQAASRGLINRSPDLNESLNLLINNISVLPSNINELSDFSIQTIRGSGEQATEPVDEENKDNAPVLESGDNVASEVADRSVVKKEESAASSSNPTGLANNVPGTSASAVNNDNSGPSNDPPAATASAGPSRPIARPLVRSNAFYDRSHPQVFWDESWGPKPSPLVRPLRRENCVMDLGLYSPPPSGIGKKRSFREATSEGTTSKGAPVASGSQNPIPYPRPTKRQKLSHSSEPSPLAGRSADLLGRLVLRLPPLTRSSSSSGSSSPPATGPLPQPSFSSGKGKKRAREEVEEEDASTVLPAGEQPKPLDDPRPARRLKLVHNASRHISEQPVASGSSLAPSNSAGGAAHEGPTPAPPANRRVTRSLTTNRARTATSSTPTASTSTASTSTTSTPTPATPTTPKRSGRKGAGKTKSKSAAPPSKKK